MAINKSDLIVFLDFDGVINFSNNSKDMYGDIFDDTAMSLLYSISDKYVISSSWKCLGINYIKRMWNYRNYSGDILGITDDLIFEDRNAEINKYIKDNNIENYIVLDDIVLTVDNFIHCPKGLNLDVIRKIKSHY